MKDIVDKYASIIKDYEIITWESEPASYRFKARISFIDGSSLLIKDYLFSYGRKYAYHWQDNTNILIIRWDNTSHWKGITTYPHHRHEPTGVFPSREITLEDVLQYIYDMIVK